jgi:putative heme iron utilization protein
MPDKPENSAFKLLSSRKTLVMATADENGAPNVSYAPFVRRGQPLYVYTSSRSRHLAALIGQDDEKVMHLFVLAVALRRPCSRLTPTG